MSDHTLDQPILQHMHAARQAMLETSTPTRRSPSPGPAVAPARSGANLEPLPRRRYAQRHSDDKGPADVSMDAADRDGQTSFKSKYEALKSTSKVMQRDMQTRMTNLEKQHNLDTGRIKLLLTVKADLERELAEARRTVTDLRAAATLIRVHTTINEHAELLQKTTARLQQLEHHLNIAEMADEFLATLPVDSASAPLPVTEANEVVMAEQDTDGPKPQAIVSLALSGMPASPG